MIDVRRFHRVNVIDSCSASNVLSSSKLAVEARLAGCQFCCTYFVEYEVLHKRHSLPSPEKTELQSRFRAEKVRGRYATIPLDLEDLSQIGMLRDRRRLGMGELSSIVLAAKMRHAFLTDDQKARALASTIMDADLVQTTPQLFGWLTFIGRLNDTDKSVVLEEHRRLNRPLAQYLEEAYLSARGFLLAATLSEEEATAEAGL